MPPPLAALGGPLRCAPITPCPGATQCSLPASSCAAFAPLPQARFGQSPRVLGVPRTAKLRKAFLLLCLALGSGPTRFMPSHRSGARFGPAASLRRVARGPPPRCSSSRGVPRPTLAPRSLHAQQVQPLPPVVRCICWAFRLAPPAYARGFGRAVATYVAGFFLGSASPTRMAAYAAVHVGLAARRSLRATCGLYSQTLTLAFGSDERFVRRHSTA